MHYISVKNGPTATKQKANISIELLSPKRDHWIWPWPWHWPWIFKVEYGICYISAKNFHETKSKHIDWTLCLKCDHRIWTWPWPLAMKFQGQNWNMLYLSQRWFHCHIMKSTYIEWSEDLNYNHVWPWPWKTRCTALPDSDRENFRYRRTDSFSLCHSQTTTCMTLNSIEDVIFLHYYNYYYHSYHYYHHDYHIIHQIYINTASAMSTFIQMLHGNKWL